MYFLSSGNYKTLKNNNRKSQTQKITGKNPKMKLPANKRVILKIANKLLNLAFIVLF